MANLTEASKQFKMGLKFLLVGALGYYLVILLVVPGVKTFVKKAFPPKDPPNVAFGTLDPLKFVAKPTNTTVPKYSLNTTNGRLPQDFPTKMKVYKTKKPTFSFMMGTSAIKDASFLGFTDDDLTTDLKGEIYKWRKLSTESTLEIEIQTKKLKLMTNIPKNLNTFPEGLLNDESTEKAAIDLFKGLWRYNDALYPEGEIKINYGTIKGSSIQPATSSRDRQVAMVNFFRSIGDYPILGPDPTKGLLHAIIRRPTKEKTPLNYPVVEAYYWEIDTDSNATYPLVSVQEAWNAVSQNNGIITHIREKYYNPFEKYTSLRVDTILIDNIYLAYYETPDRQLVIQPIYVFEGNYQARGTAGGEITVYYPAIDPEYIAEPTETTTE